MNQNISIKNKLRLSSMLLVVLTLTFSFYAMHRVQNPQMEIYEHEKLSVIATLIAENNQASLMFDDKQTALRNLSFLDKLPFIEHACIYDFKGKLFASYVRDTVFCDDDSTSTLRNTSQIEVDGDVYGKVVIQGDNRVFIQRVKNLRNSLVFIVVMAILLGLLIVRYAQEHIVASLIKLSETAKRISKNNNFGIRAALGKDQETNELVNAFNVMLDKIEDNNKDLLYQANHDELTTVLNRRGIIGKINEIMSSANDNKDRHLLFIDIDNFKYFNDTFGYIVGDKIICWLANEILKREPRITDIGRLGGDEFCLISESMNPYEVVNLCNKLMQEIQYSRFKWESSELHISFSIGIEKFSEDYKQAADWIKSANIACHIAKEKGKSQYCVYKSDSDSSRKYSETATMIQKINYALKNDAFILFKQKISDDSNSKRYEILVRLVDEGQIILPNVFLGIAEKFDLIQKIDIWVIDNYFSYLSKNPKELEAIDWCSINISGKTLSDINFYFYVLELFEKFNIPPHKICFEITETSIITDMNLASNTINNLKKVGVRFALDDFGSGLSSFEYLNRFDIDHVKIDGQFIKDIDTNPQNYIVVKAIHDLCNDLNKKTIAEFVHKEEIADKLKIIGIDYLQGYWIERPIPLVNDMKLL